MIRKYTSRQESWHVCECNRSRGDKQEHGGGNVSHATKCTAALRRSGSSDLLDWARSLVCHLWVYAEILTRGFLTDNRASLVPMYCSIILPEGGVSWYYVIIAFQRAGHRFISSKCGVIVVQSGSVIRLFWCARVRRVNNVMGFDGGIDRHTRAPQC